MRTDYMLDVSDINEPTLEDLNLIDDEFENEAATKPKSISSRHNKTDFYCNEVANIPMLSHNEIVELAILKDAGDIEAQNKIVEANLRLVVKWAKKYATNDDNEEDLIQVGNLGLIKAVEKYDWTKGYQFSTYATWWIRQSIFRYFADCSRVIRIPVHLHDTKRKVDVFTASYNSTYGFNPTAEEIIAATGISLSTLEQLKTLPEICSFDAPITAEEESSELGLMIPDTSFNLEECVNQKLFKQNLYTLIKEILNDERQISILIKRFGLEGNRPQTLEEIAKEFNLTRERVRQIEEKSINKLKGNRKFETLKLYLD